MAPSSIRRWQLSEWAGTEDLSPPAPAPAQMAPLNVSGCGVPHTPAVLDGFGEGARNPALPSFSASQWPPGLSFPSSIGGAVLGGPAPTYPPGSFHNSAAAPANPWPARSGLSLGLSQGHVPPASYLPSGDVSLLAGVGTRLPAHLGVNQGFADRLLQWHLGDQVPDRPPGVHFNHGAAAAPAPRAPAPGTSQPNRGGGGRGDAAAPKASTPKKTKESQAKPEKAPVERTKEATNLAAPGSYELDEKGEFIMPSVGSAGHLTRTCRPCHYIHTKSGCDNGYDCSFCHCKHSKRSRPRLPKQQRLQCRELAQLVFNAQNSTEEQRRDIEAQMLVQTSTDPRLAAYATSVLRSLRGGAILQEPGSKQKQARRARPTTAEEDVFEEELSRLMKTREPAYLEVRGDGPGGVNRPGEGGENSEDEDGAESSDEAPEGGAPSAPFPEGLPAQVNLQGQPPLTGEESPKESSGSPMSPSRMSL